MLRYLSASDLVAALPMAAAIEAIEAAFVDAHAGRARCPSRTVIDESIADGERRSLLLTMPAAWDGRGFGAKVSTFLGDNPAHGLPAVQGVAVMLDIDSGTPRLLVDAAALTSRRTAAMVGLATRQLAAPDAATLGVVGTGALAREMIEAVSVVRPIGRVFLYNRTAAKADRLAESMQDMTIEVLDSADAVAERSSVLILATSSTEPVVSDRSVRAGSHINAVGNFSPRGREVEGRTVGRAELWVDSYEGAETEAGDLLLAAEEGRIEAGRAGIRGDLARLACGRGAPEGRELTLFKTVGTAIADIAGMVAAYEGAERRGLGTVLD